MNIELHNRIIEHIEKHPETWDQENYECGSKYCYGGWAIVFSCARGNAEKIFESGIAFGAAKQYLELTNVQSKFAFNMFRTLEELKDLPKLFGYEK